MITEDYRKKYYSLQQFLACYFHQDWQEEYDWNGMQPDTEKVVQHYKVENGEDIIGKTIIELQDLLSEKLSEQELRKILMELGNNHYAPATHKTYRKWLEKILEILKEPNNAKALNKIR